MSKNTRHAFALALLLFAALLPSSPALRAAESAKAAVAQVNDSLLSVMKSAEELGYQGRFERLAPTLEAAFDFPTMARVALGGPWNTLNSDQQTAFIGAFTDYSIGVFAKRFDGYSGERFEILGEEPARRGAVLVRNQIVKSDGEAIAINYLTRPDGDGANWQIVDTILGGTASELAARRSEYSSIVEKNGIVALINALKDKTAAFATE
jgi:phospholipid transport system substrate-binding protein